MSAEFDSTVSRAFVDAAVQRKYIDSDQAKTLLEQSDEQSVLPSELAVETGLLKPVEAEIIEAFTAPKELAPGYELLDVLGYGALGIVYRARQPHLHRDVAIKSILQSRILAPNAAARFQREGAAIGRLQHPNIVAAYDFGMHRDRLFLVMELVQGADLRHRLESGPLDATTGLWIIRQAAAGLAHAHSHQIIHRDIKPGNLLLTTAPAGYDLPQDVPLVKIADFGLARLNTAAVGDENDTQLTLAGAALGTPMYCAPEQLMGDQVDHRADIYALGATLFRIVAGAAPYDEKKASRVMAAKVTGQSPRYDLLPDDLDGDTRQLLTDMMEPDPESRIADYGDLLDRIDQVLRSDGDGAPTRRPAIRGSAGGGSAGKAGSSRKYFALAWFAVAVSVVAGLGVAIRGRLRQDPVPTMTLGSVSIPIFDGTLTGWTTKAGLWRDGQDDEGARVLVGSGTLQRTLPQQIFSDAGYGVRVNVDRRDATAVELRVGQEGADAPLPLVLRFGPDQVTLGRRDQASGLRAIEQVDSPAGPTDGGPSYYQLRLERHGRDWFAYFNDALIGTQRAAAGRFTDDPVGCRRGGRALRGPERLHALGILNRTPLRGPSCMPADTPQPVSRRPVPLRRKLLFSLLCTLGFLATLEIGLRMFGLDVDLQDPLAGFSRQAPLLSSTVDRDGREIVEVASDKLAWFNRQSFTVAKPDDTVRIFCVGGSTTFGRPFDDTTSYAAWLRELLPVVQPQKRWEVINAGGVSYASYRVANVMQELARYEPDLFVVYSAHNEFLERRSYGDLFDTPPAQRDAAASALRRLRIWKLARATANRLRHRHEGSHQEALVPEEVDEMLNHSIGPTQYVRDPEWQSDVLRHYELNLIRMIRIARRSGAEILFVTPASNLRDCRPFKSDDLANDASGRDLFSLAERLYRENRIDEAASLCERLTSLYRTHSDVLYLAGRVAYEQSDFARAKGWFESAVDQDICPLRATSQIRETIRGVADLHRVAVVDFESKLASRSREQLGHDCLGSEYFLDHVHPTLSVHEWLGRWIVDAMLRDGFTEGRSPTEAQLRTIRERIEARIDRGVQGTAFRNLAKVFHWSGKYDQAIPRARDSLRLDVRDLESRFLLADSLFNVGDVNEARRQYEQLFATAAYSRASLPFAELLVDQGETEAAIPYLLEATLAPTVKHQARAHFLLGYVYIESGQPDLAIESLRIAARLRPDDEAISAMLRRARAAPTDPARSLE